LVHNCRNDPDEFNRMVREAVGLADRQSIEKLRARAHHNKWPHPKKPQRVAIQVLEFARIAFWRNDWLRWDGLCWAPTSEAEMRRHLYLALKDGWYEHTQSDGSTIALPFDPDKTKVDKVIDALKAEALLPDDIEEDRWNDGRDEPVMPFANGLLRLSDRKLLVHTPEYFGLWHAPCDYDAAAQFSRGEQFLKDLTGGDTDAVQVLLEFAGYLFVGGNEYQKMLMLIGPTGSGKGTFDKLLEAVIGNRHCGVQMDDFRNNGFPKEPLLGRSLVTFSDQRMQLNAKKFTDLLLQVTGGDKVSVRLPYDRRSRSLRLPCRFMFLSNDVPVLPDNSGALLRRVIMVETPNSHAGREDFDLLDMLVGELPGFINAALDAYDRLKARGRFMQPASGGELLELLADNSSYLAQFIAECCETGPEMWVPKAVLYPAWVRWCSANGHTPSADNRFASDLYSLGGQRIRSRKLTVDAKKGVPCFHGVALRPSGVKP
jgi:P4 family phage/plasmid primase-like protien